ncbi:MAG: LysR family transcriptional regulator [Azospirillaceae bacterium]|nr:LysR family transcriptional regulator [Azospirillaceae bacterium]
MELRHLRYFRAVAHCGGIAKAARELLVAQPALTRQLRALEDELGVALLIRSARGVSLTAAGHQFIADTERLFEDLDSACKRARQVARGQTGSLRIGIAPNYTWHPTILALLRHFRIACPDVSVMLDPELSARQVESIRSGRIDAGFLAWRPKDDRVFDGLTVFSNRLLLAVPATSPYAEAPPQRLKTLRDEPFIWFPRDRAPGYYDFLIHQCHAAGFTPNLVQSAADVSTILGLVAAGMGYSLVSEASKFNGPAQAILHSHPELSATYDVELVWRSDNRMPALTNFIAMLRQHGPGPPEPQDSVNPSVPIEGPRTERQA